VDRDTADALRGHLERLYAPETVEATLPRLLDLVDAFAREHPDAGRRDGGPFDETDVWVIAYGDHVSEPDRAPLATLEDFLSRHTAGAVGGVHLLPHYPWTSDDGFAVVDPAAVAPELGDWDDVERLGGRFRLMLDAVVNHTSASSPWFRGWLQDDPAFADHYLSVPDDTPLEDVVRPRTTPLLTPFEAREGVRHVWTTFGPDQVDLDYGNPEVLLRVTGLLLDYVAHGASALRLDAVAFLWKRLGTSCIHLPETHEVIRLWRTVLDAVAPGTLLVTETNVPHLENLSYFGDGTDEAHLVYQFPLPPLVLHAFRRGDASALRTWLETLETPTSATTFLNFLGSHDGIGLRPVEALLPAEEVQALAAAISEEGGGVSYRTVPGRGPFPYELNSTYFDALNPSTAAEPAERQIARFLAAQSLLLALAGVPAIYLHSLLGSRNWTAGVERTGHPRTINREKLDRAEVEASLATPGSRRAAVFAGITARIAARVAEPAFHPSGAQRLLPAPPGLVAFERDAPDGGSTVLCVHNVSDEPQRLELTASDGLRVHGPLVELCTGEQVTVGPSDAGGGLDLRVEPYGVWWLRPPR
jgi:glucosylglycerate phosphorylase